MVSNVTAIHVGEQDRLAERIASADLITTAVGVSALEDIAEPIAKGIYLRMKNNNQAPLHIIACENAIGGSTRLKKRVYPFLDEQTRTKADRYISFPNAAVDRIVPAQDHKDPLQVTVEPFMNGSFTVRRCWMDSRRLKAYTTSTPLSLTLNAKCLP